MIENNVIVSEDENVAEIFNSFFSNAVKNLNIDSYEHFSFDDYFLREKKSEDPIIIAIEKYEQHPSVLKIKDITPGNSHFSFKPSDLKSVIKEIDNLNGSKRPLLSLFQQIF